MDNRTVIPCPVVEAAMSPATCSFCSVPVPAGSGFCPRCGAEVPEVTGEALALLRLQAIRALIRTRVLTALGPVVRAVADQFRHDPALMGRCTDALVWTGRDAFRLLDDDPDLSRALPAAERVAGLVPPPLLPELRTHVADHRKLREALVRAEAEWKANGPPSDRKARTWLDGLAGQLGFDPAGLRGCVYASPHLWPTVARALDADAFATARPLLEVAAGDAELAEKNYGRARSWYAAARKSDPALPAAADGLARCAAATADPAGAVAHSREAVRLGTADPFTFNRLAWTLCTAGPPTPADVAEAVAAARRAVELAPPVASFWDTLAEALERAGDLHAAAAAARESLRWGDGKDAYRARMDRLCDLLPAAPAAAEVDLWPVPPPAAGPRPVTHLPTPSPAGEEIDPDDVAADESAEFEVSLDDTPDEEAGDADSEFELSLDDCGSSLDPADDEDRGSIFETDSELPILPDESEEVTLKPETDEDEVESPAARPRWMGGDEEDCDDRRRPRRSAAWDEDDEPADRPGARERAEPRPVTDPVHFTVTAPAVMRPGRAYVIDAWAHLAAQRQEVLDRAREAQRGGPIAARTKGGVGIARGTVLTLRLRVPGLELDDPEDTIAWDGEVGSATFPVRVPADAPAGSLPGTLRVYAAGLEVAKLHFDLEVGPGEAAAAPVPTRERRHRTAFASYASPDRDAVLARVQGIQKVLPELDVFVDVAALRSGDRWADRLAKEVIGRDVFYLFWSAPARESEWVRREWQTALAARGVDYIDPVPLASPDDVPPPPELAAHLHFNDWVLAYTRGRSHPAEA